MASTHKGSLRVTRDLTVGTRINLQPKTTVERDALSAAFGDRIVNSDTNTIEWFDGTIWQNEILSQDHVLIECYQVDPYTNPPVRYSVVSSTTDAGATIDQYAVNVDDVTDQPDISGGIPATWIPCP